jgi:hypothetical protein
VILISILWRTCNSRNDVVSPLQSPSPSQFLAISQRWPLQSAHCKWKKVQTPDANLYWAHWKSAFCAGSRSCLTDCKCLNLFRLMKFGPRAAALAHRCTVAIIALWIEKERMRTSDSESRSIIIFKNKTGPERAHKRSLSRALIPTGLLTRCPHVVLI